MNRIQLPPYVHQFPAPAVLIGCGTVEEPNIITCAWFGVVNSEPPKVAVSIRPSRFSHPLVVETGEFTVNLPVTEQLAWVEHCGSASGRDEDKFATLGITPTTCRPLNHAPMIEECFCSLACTVEQTLQLGTHTMFVAEVVAVHADEAFVRQNRTRINPRSRDQLVYLDGKYWTLTPVE